MNIKAPHYILFAILAIAAVVLVSCGGNEDLAKKLGCPGSSIMANSDDVVVIRTAEPTGLSFMAGPSFPGNIAMTATEWSMPYSTYYGPLVVEVWEPFGGFRKNNICVVLNSDGFFWDQDFTAIQGTASSGFSRFVTKTDESGTATIWWSTGLVVSSASASGTTDGVGATYGDGVTASSGGATQAFWDASYTVKGCPATMVPCP